MLFRWLLIAGLVYILYRLIRFTYRPGNRKQPPSQHPKKNKDDNDEYIDYEEVK